MTNLRKTVQQLDVFHLLWCSPPPYEESALTTPASQMTLGARKDPQLGGQTESRALSHHTVLTHPLHVTALPVYGDHSGFLLLYIWVPLTIPCIIMFIKYESKIYWNLTWNCHIIKTHAYHKRGNLVFFFLSHNSIQMWDYGIGRQSLSYLSLEQGLAKFFCK